MSDRPCRRTEISTHSSSAVNKAEQVRIAVQELRLARSAQMGPVYFHGTTMTPFLVEGDHVIVEPVEWEDISVGDVITYRFEDKFPTRRVVAIDRGAGTLVLRGDSIAGWPQFHVKGEDVLGRAQVRLRDGRRLERTSLAWRWASARALAVQRLALALRALRAFMRGGAARIARTIRVR